MFHFAYLDVSWQANLWSRTWTKQNLKNMEIHSLGHRHVQLVKVWSLSVGWFHGSCHVFKMCLEHFHGIEPFNRGEDVEFYFFQPISQANQKRLGRLFSDHSSMASFGTHLFVYGLCNLASNIDTPSAHVPVHGHASLKATTPANSHRPWHGESTPRQRCTTCWMGIQSEIVLRDVD